MSWLRAWETFAPESEIHLLQETLLPFMEENTLMEHLPLIQGYTLYTQTLTLKNGIFVGFLGTITLEWRKQTPLELRQSLLALARFSSFCGTGAKTAQGMGQTRYLPTP
jgi:CRISPR-associated endoribonuclease Cas6